MPKATPRLPAIQLIDLIGAGYVHRHFAKQALPVDAVPTPLPKWNEACGDQGGKRGLAFGWHITVGANTGSGKTLMGINLGAWALKHGISVGYINLEMSIEQMASRLYSILTLTPIAHIEPGKYFRPEAEELVDERISQMLAQNNVGFYTNNGTLRNVDSIVGLMAYLHEQYGVRFFVVDYIQRIRSTYEDMLAQITDVSLKVSDFAKDYNVCTVALSQFNRETSKNYKDSPVSQGLMGGSPLENDSDQVVLLNHAKYERRQEVGPEGEREYGRTELIIDKNRHGKQGHIPIEWDYTTLRVYELSEP